MRLTVVRLSDVRLNVNKPTHICMHTNTRIQRYTYIHAYMHEFIHKNKPLLIITSTTEKGENDIHSFIYSFNPDIYIAPLYVHYYSGAPDHSNWQCRSLHDEALQATV